MVNMKINFTTFNDLTKQLLYKPQTHCVLQVQYTVVHTHTQYARGTCTGAHAVIIILVY